MTDADVIRAVIIIGSQAGQRCGLFAGDAADLRHAHQNRDSSLQPDAANAGDKVEPRGEIVVLADCRDQRLELDPQQPLEASNLVVPMVPDAMVATGLATGFDVSDVLGELLDQR